MGRKKLTQQEVNDYELNIKMHLENAPTWYKTNVVSKTYSRYAAKPIMEVCETTGRIPNVNIDTKCTYNKRDERAKIRDNPSVLAAMKNVDKYITTTLRHEERMCHCLFVQGQLSDFEVLDYQIPTRNGGHDKIDLLLQQGDTVYMTEAKKFSGIEEHLENTSSEETMLRCVLEIQTYYQKINDQFYSVYDIQDKSKLKKAVLVDKGTEAYKQVFRDGDKDWARKILKFFDITLLELYREDGKFKIRRVTWQDS